MNCKPREAFVVVEASRKWVGKQLVTESRYAARVIRVDCSNQPGFNFLARTEGDYEVTFATYEEAERVVTDYNCGGPDGDEVVSARWDYQKCEWTNIVYRQSSGRGRDPDQEDFHADC